MSLKSSFAAVLRRIRSKRNISQRNFGDTSRTYLSKLESGRSSITLDKLEQISDRLDLNPLTIMTLTICESTERDAATALKAPLHGEARHELPTCPRRMITATEAVRGKGFTLKWLSEHCTSVPLPGSFSLQTLTVIFCNWKYECNTSTVVATER
ncbi:helix-turn-helix domain-containing protein [Pseudomonas sp. NBRC 111134]|uniref:helix-turn-helix domain-containing protein n=1 Tax=Pseudomonas sp. NBRC 111134 TaxID=1661049 RepID=UPI0009E76FEE|nr:helix-turn-helix transcriptional regulator [Pseudomonas sp. NBRC 111134]